MSDLYVTVSLLGNDGFILSGRYQPTSRVPRPHEYEYDVVVLDKFCSWVLPFLQRDDASIGHHTPSITLHLLFFTSNNADKQRHWARVPIKISSAERGSHHITEEPA